MAINIKRRAIQRNRRKLRGRGRIRGTTERPRLLFITSNKHFQAHVIDDSEKRTLVSASTLEKDLGGKLGHNVKGAEELGKVLAERAKKKKISNMVFDRNGALYHGRVKAFADTVRKGGITI